MKEDDTESDNSSEVDNPSIDRGWAWMVVIGSLVINIIYDGCSYSFGIFFTNFLKYFGDTKSHTAWIGSLFFSVPLLCGPIASYVTSRIGYRKSTIIGGFIAAIGFSCGAFSNSVAVLCITYGIISGFGMSLPYFNSIVVEAVYFKKRRALATGIAESGAGVGTVIFAPLTNYLIAEYGWRGALLIVGGIVANIIVCGALFRPVKTTKQHSSMKRQSYSGESNSNKNEESDKNDRKSDIESGALLSKSRVETPENKQFNESLENAAAYSDEKQFMLYTVSYARNAGEFEESNDTLLTEHASCDSIDLITSLPNARLSRSLLKLHEEDRNSHTEDKDAIKNDHNVFVQFISKYIASIDTLTNTGFVLFSISNFVMYFWYDVPYVFLVDKAISLNISDTNATFLISIIGIVHTVGNICYGILGDKENISKTVLYGVSIILCGISVIFVPLFTTYVPLAILAGLFGLFSAANEAMCSIILIQVVGLKNLNQAYGVIMMLQGIANLVGPPVAGWLCDVTGQYEATFYTAGACVTAAGLVYLFLPVCNRKKENN